MGRRIEQAEAQINQMCEQMTADHLPIYQPVFFRGHSCDQHSVTECLEPQTILLQGTTLAAITGDTQHTHDMPLNRRIRVELLILLLFFSILPTPLM